MSLSLAIAPKHGRTAPEPDAQAEADAEAEPAAEPGEDAKQPRATAEVTSSLYVRSDTDGTSVVAPRIRFRQDFGRTGLDFTWAADSWSSASVDIRTAATDVVKEWRDELGVAADHERGAWTVGAAYRYSREVDYLAHGPSLRASWEGLQRNLRVEGRASLSDDRVSRAGDAALHRTLRTMSAWLAITQVLSRGTLLQVAFEHRTNLGYQASPYRRVGLGGPVTCTSETPLCIPEVTPNRRHRFAAAARLRQSLHPKLSLGLDYRYYIDSWRLQSHTLAADLRALPHPELLLALEYRFYAQGSAYFYSSAYPIAPPRFVTRDRELSSMFDHGAAAVMTWTRAFTSQPLALGLGLHLEMLVYGYDDFPGLARVLAGQGTFNLSLGFT